MNGPPETPVASARATTETVLIVADAPNHRECARFLLEHEGYLVIEAATGKGALATLSTIAPDLILLDVNLTGLSGIEVCRRIKADPLTAGIPVLLTSATAIVSADADPGGEGAADAYLTPPVAPEELLALVRVLLRMRRAESDALAQAERWDLTFRQATGGMAVVDLDEGVLDEANPAFAALAGRPPTELRGTPVTALVADGAERRLLVEALRTGHRGNRTLEVTFIRPDGSGVPVLLRTALPPASSASTAVIHAAVLPTGSRRVHP